MTTTKVSCDGCGEECGPDRRKIVWFACPHSDKRGLDAPEVVVCPDCWKKMKEALKDVEP